MIIINILILNWNSSDDISTCIKNIVKSSFIEYRIILIDNNSEESDKQKLKQIYHEYKNKINIHLVMNDSNYGYAGGNNKGYEYLKEQELDGDIFILNPDIEIAENTLYEMVKALSADENIGAVMSRTLTADNRILYDCIKMNGFRQKWFQIDEDLVETDYVAGSCMLLRRSIINKIGLFDDSFFMYWEEVDLSYRIKNMRYKLVSTTKTYIMRKENSTERSINSIYFYTRNTFLLRKKFNLNILDHYIFLSWYLLLELKTGMKSGGILSRVSKFINGFIDGYRYL
jgi:GT2 family glycosyltransferase